MDSEKFDLDIYGDDTPQEVNISSVKTGVHSGNKENVSTNVASVPAKPQAQQGTKRKELPDDRPVDQNAALALVITDLHWWVTEDDVRGWANQAGCEGELKDLSFNEHKVNGKSKGQVYIEFSSLQASTAVKHIIDQTMQDKQTGKKFVTSYHHMSGNPYRTLPKDVPGRRDQRGPLNPHQTNAPNAGKFGQNAGVGGHNNFAPFRGRGGFQNNNRGGFQNRNFSQPAMPPPQPTGFPNMFGAANAMNPPQMNTFGGFNRGGMMGAMPQRGGMAPRGGRGGMGMGGMMNPMMGGMAAMPMGMPMGMNMGMPMGMMGNGPMPMNNPNQYYQAGANAGNDGNWNPHGNKRPRPE